MRRDPGAAGPEEPAPEAASSAVAPGLAVVAAEAEAAKAVIAQRCTDVRPHGPHPVPARGTWTGFTCPGQPAAAELERLLDEAFGGVMDSRGPN